MPTNTRINITLTPEVLAVMNGAVPLQRRSKFLMLSAMMALAKTERLRKEYAAAIRVLLRRVG